MMLEPGVRLTRSWMLSNVRLSTGEGKKVTAEYERPQLLVLGSVAELTFASGNDGNDPCRNNPPRGNKQTGPADYILGQANLATCSA